MGTLRYNIPLSLVYIKVITIILDLVWSQLNESRLCWLDHNKLPIVSLDVEWPAGGEAPVYLVKHIAVHVVYIQQWIEHVWRWLQHVLKLKHSNIHRMLLSHCSNQNHAAVTPHDDKFTLYDFYLTTKTTWTGIQTRKVSPNTVILGRDQQRISLLNPFHYIA